MPSIMVSYLSSSFVFPKFEISFFLCVVWESLKDAKNGTIEKWLKKEGDPFISSEVILEVTLDGCLTIGINAGADGYLANIIKEAGEKAAVQDPVALFVNDKDSYLTYIESQREAAHDEELTAITKEVEDSKRVTVDNKSLLRALKQLQRSGELPEGSGIRKIV